MIQNVSANGAKIPAIGFGTWDVRGEACVRMVAAALGEGYRHIDTAAMYDNETQVDEGLRASGIAREQVFVTTKVWYDRLADKELQRSAEQSLKRLGLDAVDLLLIHWPNPAIALKETMKALCDVKARGLARHVGVSNFTVPLVEEANALSSEPIAVNQVEYHVGLDQSKVLAACRKHGMALTAYSPLGKGDLFSNAALKRIGAAHSKSAGQVALQWLIQQDGVIAIPRSNKLENMKANLAVGDFVLSAAEMAEISAIDSHNGRMIDPAWAPNWD